MNLTQHKIYKYLQNHPTATTAELSDYLGMTAANIRHHLARMAHEGIVEAAQQAPAGRGRPTYHYHLTDQVQLNNLSVLANALLLELFEMVPAAERPAVLQHLAGRLLNLLSDGSPLPAPDLHLTRRLTMAVQILNACHYECRWEAHANGPRLMLSHCPYAALLSQHPELCQVDAILLEKLLGAPMKQTARKGANVPLCIFQVG